MSSLVMCEIATARLSVENLDDLHGWLFVRDICISRTAVPDNGGIFIEVNGIHLCKLAGTGNGFQYAHSHGYLHVAFNGTGRALLDQHGESGNQHAVQHARFALSKSVIVGGNQTEFFILDPLLKGDDIFCHLPYFFYEVRGILAGCALIAVMGGLDDVFNLNAWVKLIAQIGAAAICVSCGVVLDGLTNFLGSGETVYYSQWVSILITMFWIVGCTNAINLIDGLDGLAVGMSAISAGTLFVISLGVETATANVSVLLLCVIGACVGFWPYNKHPAKIFMGDVGSQMLGFLLGTISIIGIFKMHALVTMLVPFMAMAVPLADTAYAFIRRIVKGQSPFHPDKGHFHHRLLALGLTQSQAVYVMYGISLILGLLAFLMIGKNQRVKIVLLAVALFISLIIILYVFFIFPRRQAKQNTNPDLVADQDIKIYEKKGRQ